MTSSPSTWASPGTIAGVLRQNGGSLVRTIESLASEGRSLRRFTPPEYGPVGEALAETDLLDPESAGAPAALSVAVAGRRQSAGSGFGGKLSTRKESLTELRDFPLASERAQLGAPGTQFGS
jgi:hypothetical protein